MNMTMTTNQGHVCQLYGNPCEFQVNIVSGTRAVMGLAVSERKRMPSKSPKPNAHSLRAGFGAHETMSRL